MKKIKKQVLATKLKDETYAAKYSRAKYYYSKTWEEVYTIRTYFLGNEKWKIY